MAWYRTILIPLLVAPFVNAFTFTFEDKATQCRSTRVTIADGGEPPFRLVLVPAGLLPDGETEIRTIIDVTFEEREYTLEPLAFPGNSNFIAIMSDATGVGTGGTSVITDVAPSDDSSCLATEPTQPLFFIFTEPQGPYTQCSPVRISWDDRTQGRVSLWGLIPGGESFEIPVNDGDTSVEWTPQVVAGTNMLIVAGDDRGRGTGGSTPAQAIQGGSDGCLNGDAAYSSTNSPYAGGQYMTGSGGGTVTGGGNTPSGSPTSSPNQSGDGSKKNNVPMIVGIVVGVVVGLGIILILFLLWWRRRDRQRKRQRAGIKEIDLLNNGNEAAPKTATAPELQPTPFIPPAPASSSGDRSSVDGRGRESVSTWRSGAPLISRTLSPTTEGSEWMDTATSITEPTSPGLGIRGSHPPSSWQFGAGAGGAAAATAASSNGDRPKTAESTRNPARVSYVQHQDAGAIPEASPSAEPEVIDLPPSYNDINQGRGGTHVSPT